VNRRAWLGTWPAALFAAAGLGGCGFEEDYRGPDAPRFVPPPPERAHPRIALVLGSGGPRGFAHVGALKVLEEEGVRPDLVVGASVGAMVGAMLASGHTAGEVEKVALDLNVLSLVDLAALFRGRKVGGAAIARFVAENVGGRTIEEFPLGFAAVAVRAADGALTIFNHGNAGIAVRASSAIPGRFDPVRIEGVDYIDGDELTPLPIRVARELGARVVIAVNVSEYMEDTPPGVPQEWITKGWRRAHAVEAEAPLADVVIHPNTGYYTDVRHDYRVRSIATAAAATREAMPRIRAAIARLDASRTPSHLPAAS
jgi:NTE family protein